MNILIASPLEAHLVERIATAAPDFEVLYDPTLLPAPRYPSDHRGNPGFVRDPAAQARWNAMLGVADVFFGVPGDTGPTLAAAIAHAPALRWVQGTAAGAGEQVRAAQLDAASLERIAFTSAAGVHGGMLAEFAFYGLLALRKDARRLDRIRSARGWDHYPMDELAGSTIAIVGLGGIGRAVARRARAFDMHVIGIARTAAPNPLADEMVAIADIGAALQRAETIVVTLPGTDTTRGLIDRTMIASWRPSAVFINVGRGAIVDEVALTAALAANAIRGAVLDVFQTEPLPADNPLWSLPNVIFSPHTAALSVRENERIVELFCENIGLFTARQPLRNTIDIQEFY